MILHGTLLIVVVLSYGTFRQSLLYPNEEFSWLNVIYIFTPFFMMFGETSELSFQCTNRTMSDGSPDPTSSCVTGHWLNPPLLVAFLFMVVILLWNLLIAIFNSIFTRLDGNSERIWKFSRYSVIMEYERKSTLPPPLTFFGYFYFFCIQCCRRLRGNF